jgi:hypothetical protein
MYRLIHHPNIPDHHLTTTFRCPAIEDATCLPASVSLRTCGGEQARKLVFPEMRDERSLQLGHTAHRQDQVAAHQVSECPSNVTVS